MLIILTHIKTDESYDIIRTNQNISPLIYCESEIGNKQEIVTFKKCLAR